jgi:hypothetical protein
MANAADFIDDRIFGQFLLSQQFFRGADDRAFEPLTPAS